MGEPEIDILFLIDPLGQVILPRMPGRVCGFEHRALRDQQRDVALQPDREGKIAARRDDDGAAAGARCGHDRLVDRVRIEGAAVALRAIVAPIGKKIGKASCRGRCWQEVWMWGVGGTYTK